MPLLSRKKNPNPPVRRVVDFDTDEHSGLRIAVLSCGHKHFERASNPKRLNSHMRCTKCASEGNFAKMPEDSIHSSGKAKFCKRCHCRLRRDQQRDVCDPCRGGG